MYEVVVTIDAFLFITRSGINYRPVSKHGSAFIRYVKDVSVAFLALLILEGSISYLAVLLVIVGFAGKMYDDIFYSVGSFGVEKVPSVVRSRKVTVHTICHEALGVIYVC